MDIAQHLSVTLKTLRQQRGWSLSRLAEETGVSKAMLGQIERNESSPTVATLWKIATGLTCRFPPLSLPMRQVNRRHLIPSSRQGGHAAFSLGPGAALRSLLNHPGPGRAE